MKIKSALSYFGSDSEVAADLASKLDDCAHVTIPFVGGASIIPHLKASGIVANDLHTFAYLFYQTVSGRYGKVKRDALIKLCETTLSHPAELDEAHKILDRSSSQKVEKVAWAFWASCWIGRKGSGGTKKQGGKPSVRRTAIGGNNASRIKAAAHDLDAWATHFERCEFENVCFRKLLPKVKDQKGCGIYCDPPWVNAGEAHKHSFTPEDHRDLAELLTRFTETRVVIRYDNARELLDLYPTNHWHWSAPKDVRNQAGTTTSEVWITNRVGEA